MKKIILALGCGLLLAACSSEPVRTPPLKLDYSSYGKIYLSTQDLRVIDRSAGASTKSPNIGHLFQPKLAEAANRWALDRLQATGTIGHATFIIKEASVVEQPLRKATGMDSWFTRQQGTKYVARLDVQLDAQSPVNSTIGTATAHATHAITLPEDPTDAEKNEAYRKLLDDLMYDLNQKLEQSIRQHMAPFVTQGPATSSGMQQSPLSAEPEILPPATLGPPVKPVIR